MTDLSPFCIISPSNSRPTVPCFFPVLSGPLANFSLRSSKRRGMVSVDGPEEVSTAIVVGEEDTVIETAMIPFTQDRITTTPVGIQIITVARDGVVDT